MRPFLNTTRRRLMQAAGATALCPMLPARAQSNYHGDLVVVAHNPVSPDRALPGLIDRYRAAHPGLNVRLVLYPDDKFVALLTAAQAAGEQIDMMLMNGQDLRRYAANGTLRPLDIPYQNRFIPEALRAAQLGGKLWGLPLLTIGGFPILVNKALLTRANLPMPQSYDDLKRIAAALKPEGLYAFTHPGKNIYLWPVWFFTAFAQTCQNRCLERTQEMLTGQAKFTDPDVVRALDLVFQFPRDGLLPPNVLSLDNNGAVHDFVSAKAAFMMYPDSLSHQIYVDKPAGVDLDIMLMPALFQGAGQPQFPGGPRGILGISQKVPAERLPAVMELADFLTADAQNAEFVALNGGTVPCNRAVPPADEPFVQKERTLEPHLFTYLDWYWPPEITRVFQEGVQAGMAGQAKAQEVAANAQATLERLMRDNYRFFG